MKQLGTLIPAMVLAAGLLTQPATATAQDSSGSSSVGQAYRVDDSGTVVIDPTLEMKWEPVSRSGASTLVSASTGVSVQLNVAAWVGRVGRIYMNLPRTAGPTVRATWLSGGTLLPGSVLSGDRALVYSGAIGGPMLRDTITITLEADGTRLVQPETLNFGFEIEVDQ